MGEELDICPFCKSDAEWCRGEKGDGSPWEYIACTECEAMGPHVLSSGSAEIDRALVIAAWNRRAAPTMPETAPDVVIEAMWQALCAEDPGDPLRCSQPALEGVARALYAAARAQLLGGGGC